jgi:hypothetical protein
MINPFQKIQDNVIPISFKEVIYSMDKKSDFDQWWYLPVFFPSVRCVRYAKWPLLTGVFSHISFFQPSTLQSSEPTNLCLVQCGAE